jgi:NhaP-type Na+/H+ or K+/H+ antiporter
MASLFQFLVELYYWDSQTNMPVRPSPTPAVNDPSASSEPYAADGPPLEMMSISHGTSKSPADRPDGATTDRAPTPTSDVVDPTARHELEHREYESNNSSFEMPYGEVRIDSTTGLPVPVGPDMLSVHDLLAARRVQNADGPGTPGDGHLTRAPSESNLNMSFGTMGAYIPPEVVRIARQMKGLTDQQFLMLADLTQKKAFEQVYSVSEFRGTLWYLPSIRPIDPDEPPRGVGFDRTSGLWFAACGWRLELNVVGYAIRISLLIAFWFAVWSLIPSKNVELRGAVFDPCVAVLFATIIGGILSRILRLPALMCVLWMGILWANVPHYGYLTSGINKYVRSTVSTIGLTLILIRAGLYIKKEEIFPIIGPFLAFAYLPHVAELLAHSFTAYGLFDYPDTNWAFAHGAIGAAVSPGVVVPGVLSLKLDGYWLTRGPGVIMMPAAPAEMVGGIWNIGFLNSLAIDNGEMPLWLNILLGPLQIIGGVVLGVLLGGLHFLMLKILLSEAKKLPHHQYTHEHMERVSTLWTAALLIIGVATQAYTKKVHLSGGGSVAVTVMAITTGALTRRRSEAVYFADQYKKVCVLTADLWDNLVMPALFGLVGTNINLAKIYTVDFFPKALCCLVVGLAARMIVAFLVSLRSDYGMGERFVMAAGWCGKATVQAVLAGAALDRALEVREEFAEKHGEAAAQRNIDLATNIVNQGYLQIMLCAPIAALVLVKLGPHFIPKESGGGAAH